MTRRKLSSCLLEEVKSSNTVASFPISTFSEETTSALRRLLCSRYLSQLGPNKKLSNRFANAFQALCTLSPLSGSSTSAAWSKVAMPILMNLLDDDAATRQRLSWYAE